MPPDDWQSQLRQLLDNRARRQAEAKLDRIQQPGPGMPNWSITNWRHRAGRSQSAAWNLSLDEQLDYYQMTTAAGAADRIRARLSFILAPTLIQHGTTAEGPLPTSAAARR